MKGPKYEGNIVSPCADIIRDVDFNQELATELCALKLSGEKLFAWVMKETTFFHTGTIYDTLGDPVNLKWMSIKRDFGDDPRRWLNDYKLRASTARVQRLHIKCIRRVMFLNAALEIRRNRLQAKA